MIHLHQPSPHTPDNTWNTQMIDDEWMILHNGTFNIWSLKSAFWSDKYPYQPSEAPTLIYRKSTKMLCFDHTWSTIFRKNPIIHSKWWWLVQNIINITFIIHISCKIWIYFEIVGWILSKTSFLAGFLWIRDGVSAGW